MIILVVVKMAMILTVLVIGLLMILLTVCFQFRAATSVRITAILDVNLYRM